MRDNIHHKRKPLMYASWTLTAMQSSYQKTLAHTMDPHRTQAGYLEQCVQEQHTSSSELTPMHGQALRIQQSATCGVQGLDRMPKLCGSSLPQGNSPPRLAAAAVGNVFLRASAYMIHAQVLCAQHSVLRLDSARAGIAGQ